MPDICPFLFSYVSWLVIGSMTLFFKWIVYGLTQRLSPTFPISLYLVNFLMCLSTVRWIYSNRSWGGLWNSTSSSIPDISFRRSRDCDRTRWWIIRKRSQEDTGQMAGFVGSWKRLAWTSESVWHYCKYFDFNTERIGQITRNVVISKKMFSCDILINNLPL